MSKNPGTNPFGVFLGLDGRPLNGGDVYIGLANQDPETNPQQAYWDADGLDPATQPLETLSGYIVNNGSVARFWTENTSYSIRVRDRQNNEVFYSAAVEFEIPEGTVLPPNSVQATSLPTDDADNAAIADALLFQQDGVGAAYRSIQTELRETVKLTQFDQGDGWSAAFGRAITYLASTTAGTGKIVVPAGVYPMTAQVDCTNGGAGVTIEGAGPEATTFTTTADITLFLHGANFNARDFQCKQLGTAGTGRAFSTSSTGEASYCSWERINAYDFKYGWIQRYSLRNRYEQVRGFGNTCGIRLARNDSMDDQTNPNAPSGWNVGWYHNENTFNDVTFFEGEVGFWGSVAACTFNGLDCEGQVGTGASNSVLPAGYANIGAWFDGGSSSDLAFGNVLNGFYSENSQVCLRAQNQRALINNAPFTQGFTNVSPFKIAYHVINANHICHEAGGQDYFERMVKLETATHYGAVPGFGTVSNYDADAGSLYYANNDRPEVYIKKYSFSKTGSSTTTTFTVPVDFQDNTSYRVTINGYTDSSPDSNKRQVAYDISRINSATSTSKDISSGTETNFTSAIVDRNIVFTVTTALRFDATVTVEKFGEFPSQSAVITGV